MREEREDDRYNYHSGKSGYHLEASRTAVQYLQPPFRKLPETPTNEGNLVATNVPVPLKIPQDEVSMFQRRPSQHAHARSFAVIVRFVGWAKEAVEKIGINLRSWSCLVRSSPPRFVGIPPKKACRTSPR